MVRKKKISKKRWGEIIFFTAMIIIPVIHFCIFWIGVNVNSFALAFQGKDGITFDYFKLFFQELTTAGENNKLLEGIKNTLIIFGLNNFILLPLSVLFSYFLYKQICCYKYFRVVFFLPSIISSVVLVTLYKEILNGPISNLLMQISGSSSPILFFDSTRYAFKSVLIYICWLGIAGNMVIYSGTMSRTPTEIVESAKLDGIGYFGELFYIVLPLMWPTLSVIVLLGVVGIFTADGPILLMTQGQYETYTLGYWFYDKTIVNPNLNYGAAVGICFTMFSIPITLFARWLVNKIDSNVEF
ncbi:MAG: carbohydrate ABC transporter permease [Candidatus Gallimonas sp.]